VHGVGEEIALDEPAQHIAPSRRMAQLYELAGKHARELVAALDLVDLGGTALEAAPAHTERDLSESADEPGEPTHLFVVGQSLAELELGPGLHTGAGTRDRVGECVCFRLAGRDALGKLVDGDANM